MKEFAKAFYKSELWLNARETYAKSVGWLCEDCLAKGVYTPGVIVHHIQHLTPENINDLKITTGFDNLRLVCRDCHAAEHRQQTEKRFSTDENGNIIPP